MVEDCARLNHQLAQSAFSRAGGLHRQGEVDVLDVPRLGVRRSAIAESGVDDLQAHGKVGRRCGGGLRFAQREHLGQIGSVLAGNQVDLRPLQAKIAQLPRTEQVSPQWTIALQDGNDQRRLAGGRTEFDILEADGRQPSQRRTAHADGARDLRQHGAKHPAPQRLVHRQVWKRGNQRRQQDE